MDIFELDRVQAQSLGGVGVSVMKAEIEHDGAEMSCPSRAQFRRKRVIGYYIGTVMYKNQ